LGVQLFEREHRQVVTTAAGQAFVARARALLLEADALIESARLYADPFSATMRIGVIPTVAPCSIPSSPNV
jgi:LysR family hydrogen peroxide-inducible transcriptional activator